MAHEEFLNIGCGPVFLSDSRWLNVDLNGDGRLVKPITLKGLLSQGYAGSFKGVYSSHVIEHLSVKDGKLFFSECSSLIQPGGYLRIVTPDFDSLVDNYICARDDGDMGRAKLEKLLLLEQCVRSTPGGRFRQSISDLYVDYGREYIANIERSRIGEALCDGKHVPLENTFKSKTLGSTVLRFWRRNRKRMNRTWFRTLRLLIPHNYKSNVLTTEPGERHLWIYSSNELDEMAQSAGFKRVATVGFDISCGFVEEDIRFLDVREGKPRKGGHSMFVEYQKV